MPVDPYNMYSNELERANHIWIVPSPGAGTLTRQDKFHLFFRMTKDQFSEMLYFVEPLIRKCFRSHHAVNARQRLSICLR